MKKRYAALFLALVMLLSVFASCKTQTPNDGETSGTDESATETEAETDEEIFGEEVAISSDGKLEWTVLGVYRYDSFAGLTPKNGKMIVVELEARNKSDMGIYVSSAYLETNIEPVSLEGAELPAPYSAFGRRVASGCRRVFALCFDLEPEWFKLEIDYKVGNSATLSEILFGDDYKEDTVLSKGNTAYQTETMDVDTTQRAELASIKEKYLKSKWGSPNETAVANLTSKLAESGETLYFTNVDYESTSASAWNNAEHLNQLLQLIPAYGKERLATDTEARETVMAILDHWLENDYICSVNWWFNDIKTPAQTVAVGLLLDDWLTEAQKDKMNEIISRGTLAGSNTAASTSTGANLADMMTTTVYHGLFTDDCDLVMSAVDRISGEIRLFEGDGEGMQSDGSFFQHGNLLACAGSYGTVYINGIRSFIVDYYGTSFAISEEKVKLFVDHLLDGQAYFHRGIGTTYFSIGRSAVYANGAHQLKNCAAALAALDGIYRQEDLRKYADSFSDISKLENTIKYFPYSYVLVSSAPEYHMSVRGAHESIILTEVVNLQNVLGYNLSYGSNTSYMYYGDEYSAIGAVMDYSMFPGTTAYRETDAELLGRYNTSYGKTWGKSTYQGTHCDGETDENTGIGALYMELKNDGIIGKQAFITYNGIMIALGSDLQCSKAGNTKEILTTLDQCKLNSATVGGNALTVGNTVTVSDGTAVCNGAFAYYNLGEGSLTARATTMRGSYSRTDSAQPERIDEKDVFNLSISYGTGITNGSYAYAVVANGDGAAPANADGLAVAEIINTPEVQGVLFADGHYALVFHVAGTVTLENGETVSASGADIVIK